MMQATLPSRDTGSTPDGIRIRVAKLPGIPPPPDVNPDEVADQSAMGGYQLMITADILRGRYRESFETAKPLTPDPPLPYRFALPTANHGFRPGHLIMVHAQSNWFPLYNRNPQTFAPSISWAKPEDYLKAVQRVYHAPGYASFIEMPVVNR